MDIEKEQDNWTPLLDNAGNKETDALREKQLKAFRRVLDVMDDLRCKCPWDRKQTFGSLRPQTIEEVYELSDAVSKLVSESATECAGGSGASFETSGADAHAASCNEDGKNLYREICKELGDVLLHIVFYAKLGQEQGKFDITDICNSLVDKLVYRHPHVYGSTSVGGSDDVVKNWEQLKSKEKDGNKSVLSGVPSALPSIIKAYRVQDKARAVGFDWEQKEDVWAKVAEELEELKAELVSYSAQRDSESPSSAAAASAVAGPDGANAVHDDTLQRARLRAEGELGDFIFSVVNAARLYHLNPDSALEMTNNKFIRRFNYVEACAKEMGRDIKELTLGEMDELWNRAKAQEHFQN